VITALASQLQLVFGEYLEELYNITLIEVAITCAMIALITMQVPAVVYRWAR
jgi:hypothetical protein